MRIPIAPAALTLAALLLAASCGGDGGMSPVCGNGIIEASEDCDDGDTMPCDGCSEICTTEVGFMCGDGDVSTACGEQCDDGNTDSGDGCDADCLHENCGDGTVDPGEDCDDGNVSSCDGCSESCTVEGSCGDAVLDASCEECDDGNVSSCDGCSDTCTVEPGFCGDGILDPACAEECDDGNSASCDGCSDSCTVETDICGDGILDLPCEECDDGNNVDGDGCDAVCQLEGLLDIGGDYAIEIDVEDLCGFGTVGLNTPMNVEEENAAKATVNVPIGGAGGVCNRQDYARQGNRLTRVESLEQSIGDCTVRIDVTTTFDFFSNGIVWGSELNEHSASGGVCEGLNLPCTVTLTATGERCMDCFGCAPASAATDTGGLGPLGAGTRSMSR